jgi:hypothetical protein
VVPDASAPILQPNVNVGIVNTGAGVVSNVVTLISKLVI